MNIFQRKRVFIPIEITLHTEEDARNFWDIVMHSKASTEGSKEMKKMAIELSNWFGNEAQL